jgi:hypothetical protein
MTYARLLPSLALLVLGVPLAAIGCNAQVATVLESDDAGTTTPAGDGGSTFEAGSSAEGGSAPDCATKGGECLPAGVTPKSLKRKANPGEGSCAGSDVCWLPPLTTPGSTPVCYNDAGCNEDPSMSSLAGTCFGGLCMCKPGFHVQPSGKCGATAPTTCAGGTCRQEPAACAAGELEGSTETNMACGDFIAAVCCSEQALCKAPSREAAGAGWFSFEMLCCAPNGGASAPICVNGYQTCRSGETAVDKKFGCL